MPATRCVTTEIRITMDESVLRALTKWPNVPDVFGWLSLDRRGNWLLKGERIGNPGISEFIGRNYAVDDRGRWFFQNGPQRVFVELAYTPFVLRTCGGERLLLETQTGLRLEQATGGWIDENGALLVRWGGSVGAVSDRDLYEVAQWFSDSRGQALSDDMLARVLEGGRGHRTGFWFRYGMQRLPVDHIQSGKVAQTFGFDPAPKPTPGHPDC